MAPIASAADSRQETIGQPWSGGPGVTESVNQIMARERARPVTQHTPGAAPKELHPRFYPKRPLENNPDASFLSHWPAFVNSSATNETQTPLIPQTVGSSFLGAQISDTVGFIPPDSMGCVGPAQVMVMVNGRIKVFDKNGNLGPLSTTTDNFFSSVSSAGTSDGHIRYDRLSQRWFISMIDVATDNKVLIAVSSGPIITSSGSFTFFQFQHDLVGTTPNSDTSGFADYDTLGVDRFALYIGANVFNAAGTALIGTTGYVINKSNLFSGILTVTPFRQIGAISGSGGGMWTPQGVNNDDPNATEGYFIGVDNATFGRLVLRRISNPGGTPTISANINLTVPVTTIPISQVHKGSTQNKNLDSLDDRLFGAAIHKNRITGTVSLWTAHNIQVNGSGVASSSGGRNGSRWYEIANLTTTPTLTQSGTLFDPAATSPRGFWIPTVAVSGQGHMALGCSYASVNDFAGVATAGRLRTDALGTIQAATLAVVSSTAYNLSESPNPHRWGDFSAVSIDPVDDMTLWTFQEYCNANNSWGVRAVQLKALPPATPASAFPSSLAQGQTSVDVVISGTSISGSEFFDPGPDTGGPGFSNHIAAAVGGAGVTVNTVTWSSPTNVTLNLTVLPTATIGSRAITITNPDGQTATSATGILTIDSASPFANFVASPTNGEAPLTVSFTNVSSGATNFSWDFGDGNLSSVTNPVNNYLTAGTYTVSLTAIDSGLTNVLTRTNYILVTNPAPLFVDFVAGPTSGPAPLSVSFTNLSTGATNFSWDFGDGHTSAATNPANAYASAGIYAVTLTGFGRDGTNSLTFANYIVVTNSLPTILTQPQNQIVAVGANATFSVTVAGTPPLTFQWRFNGTNISGANANVYTFTNTQFTDAGAYSVVITNLAGTAVSSNAVLTVTSVTGVIPVTGAPYTQDFDSMGPSGTQTPDGWYVGTGSGPITGTNVTAGNGSANSGGNYNFGSSGGSDRSLGSLASASTQRDTEARFINVSGSLITSFTITYSGEQWRVGGNGSVNNDLILQYSTDGANFTALGAQFDFNTPLDSGAAGPLDGNTSANRVAGIGGTYTPANSLTNGQIFYLRWADADNPAADNAMSVDDFVITFALTNPPPPLADFDGSPTNGVLALTVSFTNLSSSANSFVWDFGDGNTSALTNPSKTYTNAGSYTVTLTAVGLGGTNALTRTNYIVVTNPPSPVVADFAANSTNGLAPLTVSFTNLSSGASGFAWDFGDGNISGVPNPSNIYSNAGSYTVMLTATGAGGTNSITRTNYIVVTNLPAPVVADFAANPTNGATALTVSFTNLSSGASSFAWDFGDGNLSAVPNPSNIYSNAGSYTVMLTAIGAGGTNVLARTNYLVVTNPPPPVVANFAANPTNGTTPLTVSFTNLSSGASSFAWDFGDDNISAVPNPNNIYTNAGSYTVTFTAIGAGGTNALTRTNYIIVTNAPPPPVIADFAAEPTNGVAPLMVSFTNMSNGATGYSWDFGDGNSSTNLNPGEIYTNGGIYSVTLTAAGANGSNTVTRTNYIVVINPAVLTVAPASLDFGLLAPGTNAERFFVVSNAGAATLNGSATISLSAFAVTSGTPFNLDPSATTNLIINFAPPGEGVFSNVVIFASNGGEATTSLLGRSLNTPLILTSSSDGVDFTFSFATFNGFSYQVQYKDSLNDLVWQTAQTVQGDGTVKTVAVPIAASSQRFYRLAVQ